MRFALVALVLRSPARSPSHPLGSSTATCFAPTAPQLHTVNHLTGVVSAPAAGAAERSVIEESARIARGKVLPLDKLDVNEFDALLVPGGFGAAKNLSTFAVSGAAMTVAPEVERAVQGFYAAKKPMGFLCIAPVIAAKVLGSKATVTLGGEANDAQGSWPYAGAVEAVRALGAKHVATTLDEVCIDRSARIVSGAAYMSGTAAPNAVFDNVGKVVDGLVALAKEEVR